MSTFRLSRIFVPLILTLGIGIAMAGYFISQTLSNGKTAINTAESKGLSERRVMADRGLWRLNFHLTGQSASSLSELYAKAEKQQGSIIQQISTSGISASDIHIGVLQYRLQQFRDKQQRVVEEEHTLTGEITVQTNDVQSLVNARTDINSLIAQGINITNHSPKYYFTRLNEIKNDMLKEATRKARDAANEFAKVANVTVGKIKTARQGNVVIRDLGSEYEDDMNIEKTVRVVTTIVFYLEEF